MSEERVRVDRWWLGGSRQWEFSWPSLQMRNKWKEMVLVLVLDLAALDCFLCYRYRYSYALSIWTLNRRSRLDLYGFE